MNAKCYALLPRACIVAACMPAFAAGEPEPCAQPGRPCAGFHSHDLSFPLARDGVARAEERSATFLAVILRSGPRCSIPERERLRIQDLFGAHKVFSNRFHCNGDAQNNVRYEGVDEDQAFIAVHAGPSRDEAEELLARARETARFPSAAIRRMRVVLVHP